MKLHVIVFAFACIVVLWGCKSSVESGGPDLFVPGVGSVFSYVDSTGPYQATVADLNGTYLGKSNFVTFEGSLPLMFNHYDGTFTKRGNTQWVNISYGGL